MMTTIWHGLVFFLVVAFLLAVVAAGFAVDQWRHDTLYGDDLVDAVAHAVMLEVVP